MSDTPLTDALQAKWLAYREHEEEWGEDTTRKPKTTMYELAQTLEHQTTVLKNQLANRNDDNAELKEGHRLACERTAEVLRELDGLRQKSMR